MIGWMDIWLIEWNVWLDEWIYYWMNEYMIGLWIYEYMMYIYDCMNKSIRWMDLWSDECF